MGLQRRVAPLVLAAALLPHMAGAQECFPPCRAGYVCSAGSCVPPAVPQPPSEQARAEAQPAAQATPPVRPDFELTLGAGHISLFAGGRPDPDRDGDRESTLGLGFHYHRRTLQFAGRLAMREGASRGWAGISGGLTLVRATEVQKDESQSTDFPSLYLAIDQSYRVPLAPPGWQLLLDDKVSLDLGVGAFIVRTFADRTDVAPTEGGVFGQVRLSLFWLQIAPQVSWGGLNGLAVGLEVGLRLAF